MADFPKTVSIHEEAPREGFQIEKIPIPTVRKIELIDALSGTGLKSIKIASFVHPKMVPGMADSEEVVAGITPPARCRLSRLVVQRTRARAGHGDRAA